MKLKTVSTAYWVSTALFALWLIADGIGGVQQVEAGKEVLTHLGYPMYLLIIVGFAKFLAAAAIVQDKYYTIKEWAFAGYAINCIGAFLSRLYVHDSFMLTFMPLIFLAVMFIPYTLWKKRLSLAS